MVAEVLLGLADTPGAQDISLRARKGGLFAAALTMLFALDTATATHSGL